MQRVVFLVDMNAFFIACEMTRNPSLKGKPAAVAGDPKKRTGIVLAANYEARAFGIKTTMLLNEARRLCPDLLVVPPDHEFYETKSAQVMEILSEFSPIVEQNSIDEAWLDMTGTKGLFGTPLEAARAILDAINTRLDLWCSVGISDNKFLAKMASEMKKPQGITELWPQDVPTKLWPLPVGSIYGVGRKSAEKLNRLGIHTVGELAKLSPSYLVEIFGKGGETLYLHAHGQDPELVVASLHDTVKSIGRATTFPDNVSDVAIAKQALMQLADDVATRARRHNIKGRTVQITLKYTDFRSVTRQVSVRPTQSTQEIFLAGCQLLDQNWSVTLPIRLIGIALMNFVEESQQLSLFDQLDQPGRPPKSERQQLVDQAMDQIRDRFGKDSVKRAALITSAKDGSAAESAEL